MHNIFQIYCWVWHIWPFLKILSQGFKCFIIRNVFRLPPWSLPLNCLFRAASLNLFRWWFRSDNEWKTETGPSVTASSLVHASFHSSWLSRGLGQWGRKNMAYLAGPIVVGEQHCTQCHSSSPGGLRTERHRVSQHNSACEDHQDQFSDGWQRCSGFGISQRGGFSSKMTVTVIQSGSFHSEGFKEFSCSHRTC